MRSKEDILENLPQPGSENDSVRYAELEVQLDIRDQLTRIAEAAESQNKVDPNWHNQ